jgi:hypothetical protein
MRVHGHSVAFARDAAVRLIALASSVGVSLVFIAQIQADPVQVLYTYHDTSPVLGGSYLQFPGFVDIHIPSGQLPGPYGGWYDGHTHAYWEDSGNVREPAHPGYNFQFKNGVADIPAYIFDSEPGGYTPATTPYLRLDLLHPDYTTPAPRPPYADGNWTTQVGEYPRVLGDYKADFLSLPGDGTNDAYVVVGVMDGTTLKAIGGAGASGADIIISQIATQDNERARISVSTRTGDPSTFTDADFVPVVILNSAVAVNGVPGMVGTENLLAVWIQDYSIDLSLFGITLPVTAVKIEGIDLGDSSPGFDLGSVEFFNITDPVGVPEPMSAILMGLGGFTLWFARSRRNTRKA